jgi:lipoate-protein ligase A
MSDFSKQDFKTLNNEVLINSLGTFGIKAEASGRNDMEVDGKKISGSAYKLKLGKQNGEGRRSLHHGTMLLNLDLNALSRYLNPNKRKLESKGVSSVISRVMNLTEVAPSIDHASFCHALEESFAKKWTGSQVNKTKLIENDLRKIP